MSFTVIKHIICELTGYRPGTVDVSQADRGSRAVSCRLLENGAAWMIPDGATARVAYTLPGGAEGLYDTMPDGSPAWQIDGNTVTVQLIDQLMAQPGMAHMSIVLIGPEGGQLATWPIRVNITPDKAARLTVPENLPPYGAGFAGKIFFGGTDGTITPLTPGEGVEIVRQEDGSYALVAYGGAGGGGIKEETDPTVAPWAKTGQPEPYGPQNVPPYPVTAVNGKGGAVVLTAEDVGALPAGTKIPGKISELTNDAGFINKSVGDLVNYFTKKQTEDLIAQIPKFRIAVVQQLPATGEELVLYLVPFATAEGQYLEYIWTGGRFEVIGSQRVDLTGYATEDWVEQGYQPKGSYLLSTALPDAIEDALAQAKATGEFDGKDGYPGKDGRGIKSIARTSGNGAAGTVDTYTITYTDGATGTYQVRNGANGRDGEDGISPHIGANGNWYSGTTDTGVKAAQRGDDGLTPHVGDNGNWWLGTEDLGVSASGAEGQRGTGILYVTTTPESHTAAIGGQNPTKRMSLSTIKSEAGVDEVLVGDLIQHSYYLYPIYYIEGSYAYTKSGRSIRGSAGAGGKTTITEVVGLPYGSAPTITEASGSTSTDRKYILGIPAGAPGADYALTDADLDAIAQRAATMAVNLLPKYAGEVV